MSDGGEILERRESDVGAGRLQPDDCEAVLLDLAGDALGTARLPVIACGLAGARQGRAEASWAAVPTTPPGIDQAAHVATRDTRLDLHVLPGVRQDRPADVMHGEETKIAGFLARRPNFDGVICLPGWHGRWVHVSAGEIVSFRTFMTGELFALLSGQSILRHSVASEGWDTEAFSEAVGDAMARPAEVAAKLFSLRAEALLQDLDPVAVRARLSGLLIGIELAAARPYWLGQRVALIGADAPCFAYAQALEGQGLPVERADAARMALEGLMAAHAGLKGRAG